MTAEDAANYGSEVGNATARDWLTVTPGADPLYTDDAGRIHVTLYLLITSAGTVTMTMLSGDSRVFTVTGGMSLPVRLDVFVTHITAATAGVAAFF